MNRGRLECGGIPGRAPAPAAPPLISEEPIIREGLSSALPVSDGLEGQVGADFSEAAAAGLGVGEG